MRPALFALLPALFLLAACDDTQAPDRIVAVSDPDNRDSFTYLSPGTFTYASSPLPDAPQSADEAAMLGAINAERARGGHCPGGQTFPARAPLAFEGHLHRAASGYARVLADSGSMALPHKTGNSTPVRRMVEAGFVPAPGPGQTLRFEESLAAGMTGPDEMIAAWKTSARHCATLFSPVPHGSVARADGLVGAYWVLNVAGW